MSECIYPIDTIDLTIGNRFFDFDSVQFRNVSSTPPHAINGSPNPRHVIIKSERLECAEV